MLKRHLKQKTKELSLFKRKLKRRTRNLEKQKETIETNMNKIFSPTQIERLKTNKRTKFSDDDIAKSIALFSVGKRAYIYALKQLKLPLPSVSTLRKRVAHIKPTPGFMDITLKLLSSNITPDDYLNSFYVLSFDETNLKYEYSYSVGEDKVYPPSKNALVIMAKSLFSGIKTPIYFNYDKKMTKELIFDAIKHIRNIGGNVVAVVSDQAGANRGFWKNDMGVSTDNTIFYHPEYPTDKIFAFYDIPHALKNIRNHIIDEGLVLSDGSIIDKNLFTKLTLANPGEMKLCPKLTDKLIGVCIYLI